MKLLRKRRQLVIALSLIFAISGMFSYVPSVMAGGLTNVSIDKSDFIQGQTSTDIVNFTTATTANLTEISLEYSTTSGGGTKPANLDLSSVSLGTITGLNGSWVLDTSKENTGFVLITNTGGQSIAAFTDISIPVQGVKNSTVGDCDSSATFYDTCYMQIVTTDSTGTAIDSSTPTYTV